MRSVVVCCWEWPPAVVPRCPGTIGATILVFPVSLDLRDGRALFSRGGGCWPCSMLHYRALCCTMVVSIAKPVRTGPAVVQPPRCSQHTWRRADRPDAPAVDRKKERKKKKAIHWLFFPVHKGCPTLYGCMAVPAPPKSTATLVYIPQESLLWVPFNVNAKGHPWGQSDSGISHILPLADGQHTPVSGHETSFSFGILGRRVIREWCLNSPYVSHSF